MKIGVNALFLLPGEVGGSETYLRQALMAMPEGVAEWIVFTNAENDIWFRSYLGTRRDVTFVPLCFRATRRWVRILREQIQLPRAARRARVDVLWSAGYTAPIRPGVSSVVSVLDVQYRRFPKDLTPAARLATDALLRWGGRTAARWLTLSEFSKRELAAAFGWPENRIRVTPLAANPEFARGFTVSSHRDILRQFGIEPPYLLCVAHTYPHKNVAALIEAHGCLETNPPRQLVLVGRARRGEAECLAALRRHPRAESVIRLECLSSGDLAALYHGAEWFVFPSLYEGFGLPVLEAMAAGTPVLTTRCGAIPEVAADAAQYFDPPNAATLAAALRKNLTLSASERMSLIEKARRHAATFSWEKTARLTLETLREPVQSAH